MRLNRHMWALGLAKITSQRSTCCRRNVGCVLLNSKGHVLSTGYNGVAAGLPHCNEVVMELNPALYDSSTDTWRKPEHWEPQHTETYPNACSGANSKSGTNLDGCHAIHAEQNALLQCRDVHTIETCYVTTAPCMTCTKLLLNTSCTTIVFIEDYPHQGAEDLWASAGRKWIKYHIG